MAHIEQGNQRQYFSRAVEQVGQMEQVASELFGAVPQSMSIAQQANESKLSNYQVDLSTQYLAKNTEINTKYQQDPTNPQREVELKEAFENLASKYEVNALSQGQWNQIKNNIYNNYKQYNAQWQLKQQQTNATNDLKNGYEALTNQVSMLGMNGASVDEVRLIYKNGIDGLNKGATAVLGAEVAQQFLKDSNHDIMSTYISSLAVDNPLEAQRLMKDKGVLDDIGNAETIDKLNNYISTSLTNQNKKFAVQEIGNTLRAMKSEDAMNILNGRANLNQVMKFIESNKNIPEGSKDLILDIYGLKSKTDYYYDRDKGKIVKDPEGGRGRKGSGVPVAKMTIGKKQLCAETIEQDLHNLISFSDEGQLDVNNVKKNKTQKQASNDLIGYMQRIARMQGDIDSAYNAKVIDKNTRNRMMNSYITPVSDFLESKLSQLDEGTWWGRGQKLGYGRIAQAFNTDGLKGEQLKSTQRQKLFAQNYYLDELNKVVAKVPNLNSIYDIESLSSRQQQEIYKTASENALSRAKRWTDKPEYFFAKEYPTIYSQPFVFFNKKDSADINRAVAEAVYKREFEDVNGNSTLNLQDFAKNKMIEEINNRAKINTFKATGTLDLRNTEMSISRPEPKTLNEFYSRVKALGVTPEQFMKDAKARGFIQHRVTPFDQHPMQDYYRALREAEHAKALQDAKKRK